MSDRIVLPLPDGRWLALNRDVFEAGIAAGAEFASPVPSRVASPAPSVAKLMSGEELEAATGIPASWFATQARERRIPFRKLGRYVRFDYAEISTCEAFQRRAIPPGQINCTGSHDRKARANG
jgi:hypothetical protein